LIFLDILHYIPISTFKYRSNANTSGAHAHAVSNTVIIDGQNTRIDVDSSNNGEINLDGAQTTITSTSGDHVHTLTINSDGAHTHEFSTTNTGDGQAHNNMQPFLCVNYIIKF
jgi:microcystin-dependent protein